MRPRPTLLAGLLFTCLLLSGCSQWRYDLGTPLSNADLPQHNMSLHEVLALLGPPLRISASDTGFVMAWEHWHIREESIGFRLGVLGADFLSADWGEVRIKGEFLLLTINKEHRLSSSTHSDWDNYGGGGKAIQPLFGFVSVVDADDLTNQMPQHMWGASLLQSLPGTLNNNSSLDSGQSGLQQRGTPTAAGQQALEMD